MLYVIAVIVTVQLIYSITTTRSLKAMNATEQKLVTDLGEAVTNYTSKVSTAQRAATQKIADLIANGTDSPDFVDNLNTQIAAINAGADHLDEFAVPAPTEAEPVPVITPAATELPAAATPSDSGDSSQG